MHSSDQNNSMLNTQYKEGLFTRAVRQSHRRAFRKQLSWSHPQRFYFNCSGCSISTISSHSSLGVSNMQPWLKCIDVDYRICKSSDEKENPESSSNRESFPEGQVGKKKEPGLQGNKGWGGFSSVVQSGGEVWNVPNYENLEHQTQQY